MNDVERIYYDHNEDWEEINQIFQELPTLDLSETAHTEPHFCCIGFDVSQTRNTYRKLWEKNLSHYTHINLNLYEAQTRSIVEACSNQLPSEALMGTASAFMVHVHQWDDIYFLDLLESPQDLIDQLLKDVPALGSAFPFHIILWVDLYALEILNKQPFPLFFRTFLHRATSENAYLARNERYDSLIHQKEILANCTENKDCGLAALAVGDLLNSAYLTSDAGAYYKQALAYGKTAEHIPLLAASYAGIGDILKKETDVYNAIKCYYFALDGYKLEGTQSELANIYHKLGDAHWQLQKKSQGLLLYQHALDAYGASKQPLEKALLHKKLTEHHKDNDNHALSEEHLNKAITSFQQAGAHRELSEIHFDKGQQKMLSYDYPDAHQQALLSLGYAKKAEAPDLIQQIETFITEVESKIEAQEERKKHTSHVKKTQILPAKEEKMGRRSFLNRFFPKIDTDNK